MRAEIAKFHSPVIDDLRAFQASDPSRVGFLLQEMVGGVLPHRAVLPP